MPETTWTPPSGGSPGGIEARVAMMRGLDGSPGGGSSSPFGAGTRRLMESLMQKKLRDAMKPKKSTPLVGAARPGGPPGGGAARGGSGAGASLGVGSRGGKARQRGMEQMQYEDMLRTMNAKKAGPNVAPVMTSSGLIDVVKPGTSDAYASQFYKPGAGYDTRSDTTWSFLTGGGPDDRKFPGLSQSPGGSIGAGGTTEHQEALRAQLAGMTPQQAALLKRRISGG